MAFRQLEIIEVHLHQNPRSNLVVLKEMGQGNTYPFFTSFETVFLLEKLLTSSSQSYLKGIYPLCLKLASHGNLKVQHVILNQTDDTSSDAIVVLTGLKGKKEQLTFQLPLSEGLIMATFSNVPIYLKDNAL